MKPKKNQAYIPKLWTCLKEYSWDTFKKDILAGVTVGIVALPLAMAFAIASGVAPEQGLYTAIIAGFLISLLGGSKVQIGGPTGAFVVIIYDIIQRQGYDGLVLATLMAGVLLIFMGLFRLGTWIKFIPYPLVTGFTSGIALLIFFSQLKGFFGFQIDSLPPAFLSLVKTYLQALPTIDLTTTAVGLGTLGAILTLRRFFPSIPWGIASLFLATTLCWALELPVKTIATQFGEIPRMLPAPRLPDLQHGWENLSSLIPDAFVIAFLAGVESLLSAVIADGMIGGKHKSNCELVAQGFANIGAMFFAGIPATGAIARTVTNIKTGAKTPIAGITHSVTLFLIIFLFAPLVGTIPLPALSAILVVVAWNMSEIGHFRRLLKAPLDDRVILLTTFFLTVFVDLTFAVGIGLISASFLFMKRMSEAPSHQILQELSDSQIAVYEINGPFFFGVTDHLKDALNAFKSPPKVFILQMKKVPLIDATGLRALTEIHQKCQRNRSLFILVNVDKELQTPLEKFGLTRLIGSENIYPSLDQALDRSQDFLKREPLVLNK